MRKNFGLVLLAAGGCLWSVDSARAADAPAVPKLKDEMRQPWQRTNEDYLRRWLVLGPIHCDLVTDCLKEIGGEADARPVDGAEVKLAGPLKWAPQASWSDYLGFDGISGAREGAVVYAAASVSRAKAGKALLSVGSKDGLRVWVNGIRVIAKDGNRSITPDEDRVEIDLDVGDNTLLIKVAATSSVIARVLEPGAVTPRLNEIGPSLIEMQPNLFTVRTDIDSRRADAEPVTVQVIRPGGGIVFASEGKRGDLVLVPCDSWPDGPYEVRLTTKTAAGLLYATHLAYYKGSALAQARELAAEAARADATKPAGFTLKMLADMVDDRLGVKLAQVTGNPWPKIHSPLMEFEELMLERRGEAARIRPYGFVRLAWIDESDGSPQYCRAYLPAGYDPSKPWPLVLQLHGFNPANPVYWRWWSADLRHPGIDTEFANHNQVIFVEPHGRNNVAYIGIGDRDVMRCLAEAKHAFNVNDNRVYLTGDSMGGWGTWNVATRHPDLFAAIAPVFGGVDYHSQKTEEELAALSAADRFLLERRSSWAQAEGLLNVPIFVHHGDQDGAVNVDFSRWGVKLLQRWGYDVRYREYPGRIHETLQHSNGNLNIEWFLEHARATDPRQVRLRTAELRHAQAYWVRVNQAASPLGFMRVDAQIVDRNVIRLDTDNVTELTLSPSARLIEPERPIRVVWNGVDRTSTMLTDGTLRMSSPGYKPAKLRKTATLPGGTYDFYVTPFAVVIGTTSKDPEMNALGQQKAQLFIDGWRDAQKQPVRVFRDTEITDAEIAGYSLILFGGADANSVSARLARQLPLRVTPDSISIDGKQFKTKDAVVQLLYPNPRNAARYVWMIAANSAAGMYNADVNFNAQYEWDYLISDGRMPAWRVHVSPLALRVTQGMFDYNWRYSSALEVPGNPEARARGRPLARPDKNLRIDPELLASYVGRYQVDNGPVIEVILKENALGVNVEGQHAELVPTGESSFVSPRLNVSLDFVRDAGRVTGLVGYGNGDFEAKKLE